jgi:hypothetical protein
LRDPLSFELLLEPLFHSAVFLLLQRRLPIHLHQIWLGIALALVVSPEEIDR